MITQTSLTQTSHSLCSEHRTAWASTDIILHALVDHRVYMLAHRYAKRASTQVNSFLSPVSCFFFFSFSFTPLTLRTKQVLLYLSIQMKKISSSSQVVFHSGALLSPKQMFFSSRGQGLCINTQWNFTSAKQAWCFQTAQEGWTGKKRNLLFSYLSLYSAV